MFLGLLAGFLLFGNAYQYQKSYTACERSEFKGEFCKHHKAVKKMAEKLGKE